MGPFSLICLLLVFTVDSAVYIITYYSLLFLLLNEGLCLGANEAYSPSVRHAGRVTYSSYCLYCIASDFFSAEIIQEFPMGHC